MSMLSTIQNISTKRLAIVSGILSAATLLWIYSICGGTLYKVVSSSYTARILGYEK